MVKREGVPDQRLAETYTDELRRNPRKPGGEALDEEPH